jgi:hypothetical protein
MSDSQEQCAEGAFLSPPCEGGARGVVSERSATVFSNWIALQLIVQRPVPFGLDTLRLIAQGPPPRPPLHKGGKAGSRRRLYQKRDESNCAARG